MLKRRRKTDFQSDETLVDSDGGEAADLSDTWLSKPVSEPLKDYLKFVIYCILLAVPLYAITISIMRHDWIMVIVDALLVPVGFIHGILLLLGYVD